MLSIRLQRIGKKKLPTYRIIINEKGRDTHDRYLELLGTYNPHAKENQFQPNAERITYWISKGAEVSDTIHNLLVKAGVVKAEVKKAVFLSKKRQSKLGEKRKAEEEAAAKAKADKEAKEAAEKAAAEAAAAEAKAAKEAEEAAAKAAAEAPAEAPAAEAAPAAKEEAPAEPQA